VTFNYGTIYFLDILYIIHVSFLLDFGQKTWLPIYSKTGTRIYTEYTDSSRFLQKSVRIRLIRVQNTVFVTHHIGI
ncbi:MAG: hypothetical protein KKD28_05735, partial [Chloroflexi bacterium]|nr:hypothetical protein [Chloroflexota bacterium]